MIRYTDKLPEWVEKFRAEGLKDPEIDEIIKGKAEKYINKWGNTSKVGILINAYDGQWKSDQERLAMSPRNQAARQRQADDPMSPQGRPRLSSLPALDQRGNTALPKRRTKSISQRGQNQT